MPDPIVGRGTIRAMDAHIVEWLTAADYDGIAVVEEMAVVSNLMCRLQPVVESVSPT